MKIGFRSYIIILSTRTLCLKNPECQIHPLPSSTLLIRYRESLEQCCLCKGCSLVAAGRPGTFLIGFKSRACSCDEGYVHVCLTIFNLFLSQNTSFSGTALNINVVLVDLISDFGFVVNSLVSHQFISSITLLKSRQHNCFLY